jgi:hypothetical protein
MNSDNQNLRTFSWPITLKVECAIVQESGLKTLLLRNNENCRGIDLPENRRNEIQNAAIKLGMTLHQAMSLRRQLIRIKHGYNVGIEKMGLGSEKGARDFSMEIEDRVRDILNKHWISFTDENSQRASKNQLTPDFLISPPILINKALVHWIEVKTYYAAASITSKKVALGKIPSKIERYADKFGTGALIFGQGFHIAFQQRLNGKAICLDLEMEVISEIKEVHINLRFNPGDGIEGLESRGQTPGEIQSTSLLRSAGIVTVGVGAEATLTARSTRGGGGARLGTEKVG